MTPLPTTKEPCIFEEDSSSYLKAIKTEEESNVSENRTSHFDTENGPLSNENLSIKKEPEKDKSHEKSKAALKKISYECAICEAKVSNKNNMIRHLRKKHNFPDDSKQNKNSNAEESIYSCDTCKKVYNHKSSLIKHNRMKHNINIEKTFKCDVCPSQFNSVYNMNAHKKKKHPTEVYDDEEEVEFETPSGEKMFVKGNRKKPFLCNMCGKRFSHLSGLSYHKKNKHGSVVERPYNCSHCDAKYAMKRSLQLHLRKKHNFNSSPRPQKCPKPGITCVLCSMTFPTSVLLCKHYTDVHQVNIESETIEFASFNHFQDWKLNLERETAEKFILERGCQVSKDKTKKFRYLCHRSGHFVRRGGGFRRLKNQGSKKMNAHCPAMMSISEFADGVCKGYLIKTHVGHSADLCHIFLTPVERSEIATQIASKVSFDEILDNIRHSVSGCPSERIHLLKRKDLHNIEKEFSLSGEAEKHQNDAVSIHTWINSVANTVDPCVLFYKPQSQASDVSDNFLKVDDFVLILMNTAQSDTLLKYCHEKIIIDGTFISQTDYYLITLLIIDDSHHSFPAAFLVSNRIDEEILFLFYYQIKLKVGTILTNVFMSDVEEPYYSAWVKVMGQPCNRFWSSWQVDSSWRRNIKNKIRSNNKRAEVYKILRVLCQERSTDSFMKTLNNFMENVVQDVTLEDFRAYFSPFVAFPSRWASCYRGKSGINNNTHSEQMHRTLRHIFVKGRRLKGLDKVMIALMKLVHDLYYRNLVLQRGNSNAKISMIKNRHNKSLSLLPDTVMETPKGWQVPSSDDDFLELCCVSRNPKKQVCTCKLFCEDCKVCIHIYHCECIDSSILGNMCEHIHLVCSYLKRKDSIQTASDPLTLVDQIAPVDPMASVDHILSVDQMRSVDQMVPVEEMASPMMSVEQQIDTNISTLQTVETVSDLMDVDSYEIYVMPEEPHLDIQPQIDISTVLPDLMQRKENVINLFLEAVNSVTNFEDMVIIERATADLVNSLATVSSFATHMNQ